MLQAERSQVQFPLRPMDFSTDLILPATLWPWGRPKSLAEMTTQIFLEVCLENLGVLMSHNPVGLLMPVTGIALLFFNCINEMQFISYQILKMMFTQVLSMLHFSN
jgi:hypothetical protein